ncbi:hypothetical protein H2248_005096 [Termitomyces sp. 'cryptogamus']|nr:hypothetical protein H2248_005096 [Termitomyces sp. 'cryptogamus']
MTYNFLAIVTNSVTAIVLLLATASIGGIYSSTDTDMVPKGILDRYRQIKPKLLFVETEIYHAGRTIDLISNVSEHHHWQQRQWYLKLYLEPLFYLHYDP